MTSHGSVAPEIGAAVAGCGVQTRGMWPSPASRPEVGSRPIQPAPGRYASAQACRSVKSASGPARAVQGLLVGAQLHQVTRHEPGGQTEPAQDLHEQPGAVPARPEPFLERLVGRLDAGFHADGVGDRAGDPLVELDEEVDDALTVGPGEAGPSDQSSIH